MMREFVNVGGAPHVAENAKGVSRLSTRHPQPGPFAPQTPVRLAHMQDFYYDNERLRHSGG